MNRGKRLSRRAMLRGMGAAVALPFLDAMYPAFAAPRSRSAGADSHGVPLRAERHRDGRMDADRRRWASTPLGGAAADHAGAGAVSQRRDDAQRPDVATAAARWETVLATTAARARRISRASIRRRPTARTFTPALDGPDRGADSWRGRRGSRPSNWAAKRACRAATATTATAARTATAFRGGRRARRCRRRSGRARYSSGCSARRTTRRIRSARAAETCTRRAFWTSCSRMRERLKTSLGGADRRKLDEYLYGIREIETRIQKMEKDGTRAMPAAAAPSRERADEFRRARPDHDRPAGAGIPDRFRPGSRRCCWRSSRARATTRRSASPRRTTA